MKYMFLAMAMIAGSGQAIETDKAAHTFAGALAGGFTTCATQSFTLGVGAATLAGLGKEIYDSRSGGTGFNGADLGYTVAGGVVAAGTAKLFKCSFWVETDGHDDVKLTWFKRF